MATQDTCCTIVPYFKVHEGKLEAFRSFCEQFVERTYLPWAEEQKRPSTHKGYKDIWSVHLKARCGSIRLRDFRTCDGERLLAETPEPTAAGGTGMAESWEPIVS